MNIFILGSDTHILGCLYLDACKSKIGRVVLYSPSDFGKQFLSPLEVLVPKLTHEGLLHQLMEQTFLNAKISLQLLLPEVPI